MRAGAGGVAPSSPLVQPTPLTSMPPVLMRWASGAWYAGRVSEDGDGGTSGEPTGDGVLYVPPWTHTSNSIAMSKTSGDGAHDAYDDDPLTASHTAAAAASAAAAAAAAAGSAAAAAAAAAAGGGGGGGGGGGASPGASAPTSPSSTVMSSSGALGPRHGGPVGMAHSSQGFASAAPALVVHSRDWGTGAPAGQTHVAGAADGRSSLQRRARRAQATCSVPVAAAYDGGVDGGVPSGDGRVICHALRFRSKATFSGGRMRGSGRVVIDDCLVCDGEWSATRFVGGVAMLMPDGSQSGELLRGEWAIERAVRAADACVAQLAGLFTVPPARARRRAYSQASAVSRVSASEHGHSPRGHGSLVAQAPAAAAAASAAHAPADLSSLAFAWVDGPALSCVLACARSVLERLPSVPTEAALRVFAAPLPRDDSLVSVLPFEDHELGTALHVACGVGEPAVVVDALAAGYPADWADVRGRTAVHEAARAAWAGDDAARDIVQTLLASLPAGAADVLTWADADGRTPLHDAAAARNTPAFALLAEHCAAHSAVPASLLCSLFDAIALPAPPDEGSATVAAARVLCDRLFGLVMRAEDAFVLLEHAARLLGGSERDGVLLADLCSSLRALLAGDLVRTATALVRRDDDGALRCVADEGELRARLTGMHLGALATLAVRCDAPRCLRLLCRLGESHVPPTKVAAKVLAGTSDHTLVSEAVALGRARVLAALCEDEAVRLAINEPDRAGRTALVLAARGGHEEAAAARFLAASREEDALEVLWRAAPAQMLDAVRARSVLHQPLLLHVLQNGCVRLARELFAADAFMVQQRHQPAAATTLSSAILSGSEDCVRAVLEAAAHPLIAPEDALALLTGPAAYAPSPFHLAATMLAEDSGVVEQLYDACIAAGMPADDVTRVIERVVPEAL